MGNRLQDREDVAWLIILTKVNNLGILVNSVN